MDLRDLSLKRVSQEMSKLVNQQKHWSQVSDTTGISRKINVNCSGGAPLAGHMRSPQKKLIPTKDQLIKNFKLQYTIKTANTTNKIIRVPSTCDNKITI